MGGVMFLPQKPYLAQGTLRDQVIYPHTEVDMKAHGVSDSDLLKILVDVRLAYLPSREGGWDCQKEWKDVLSGGEKQRISLARVLYHCPAFAILDEPTSAVSSDVEGHLYATTKDHGITLLTISSRASLKKYHSFQLTLDGHGGWAFEKIGGKEEQTEIMKELETLKEKLRDAKELETRYEEVQKELGRVWIEGGEELAGDEAETSGQDDMGESYAEVAAKGPEVEEKESTMAKSMLTEGSGELVESETSADAEA